MLMKWNSTQVLALKHLSVKNKTVTCVITDTWLETTASYIFSKSGQAGSNDKADKKLYLRIKQRHTFWKVTVLLPRVKREGKVHPRTGHEDQEGE